MWYSVSKDSIDFRIENLNKIQPMQALEKNIEYIMSTYTPPYYIMCSGGIDSQAMLHSWILFGKDYIPLCITYNKDLNQHDISNLKKFSKYMNIEIVYKDFDLLNFLQNRYPAVSKKFECSSPQIATYISMVQDLDGTAIFGGNVLSGNGVYLTRALLGLLNASKEQSIVPYFFLESKEVAYIRGLVEAPKEDFNIYGRIYELCGLKIFHQEKKLTGFELVKDLYDKLYLNTISLQQRMKYSTKPSKRAFDIMLRYPFEIYGPEEMDIMVSREFLPNF